MQTARHRRHTVTNGSDDEEIDLVRRALAVRRARQIGPLWSYEGRYWISTSELDPFGSRELVSRQRLLEIVRLKQNRCRMFSSLTQ
jgi:hypothetical protein